MPFTYEDIERIEIEKEMKRQKKITRNRKIVFIILYFVFVILVIECALFFFERMTVGGL